MRRILQFLLFLSALQPAGAQENNDHNFEVAKQLEVFNAIYKQLDLMYVDTLKAEEAVGVAIEAMLHSLDPYTSYYPAEKSGDLKEMYTGKFAGIGAVVRYNNQLKRVIIDEPYRGMPAAEAGLRKGDVILAIDDLSMEGKDVSFVSKHLRGDPGTTFVLTFRRPSTGKTMQKKITRRTIQRPAVTYYGMRTDGVGYIALNQFTEGCAQEVRRAFVELKHQGMTRLVFDLRDNGGGSESEAVNIVNIFVPKNVLIVSNRGKMAKVGRDYYTRVEPIDTLMPVVVLVNDGTASASEITSGALQDLDRAVVLGSRTYGKGLAQISTDLPYNGSLKLTTNKFYIPSGRCIQAINYRHGRGGYVEHIPDSLTHVFHTQGGREVRDGGGIKPDVEVLSDSLSNMAYYLSVGDTTEVMLNYVVDYVSRHQQIAPAEEFCLSDADYEDFKQRVLASGFTYGRQTETYLQNLVKLAKFEGYYEDAKEDFDNLERKLSHNLAKDLDFNREQLRSILNKEIVESYYFQEGVILNALRTDKQMAEAMRLLGNLDEYNRLLGK